MPKPQATPARTTSTARRSLLGLIALLLLIWWVAAILLPDGPSYSLTAVTERIELEVAQSPAPLGWGGLEVREIDGTPFVCSVKALPIGSRPLKITITAPSKRVAKAAPTAVAIELRPQGEGPMLVVPCASGMLREVKSSVVLEPTRGGPPMTLFFVGNVTAGASPDSQGGESNILLAGLLRATEKLKGSTQPGASSQFELLAGDSVSIAAQLPDKVAATGLVWRDEDGLQLVAHATHARITIDRPGIGRLQEVSLQPGLLAVLLANTTLLMLCTLLATALTFLPTLETYLQRLRAAFASPATTRTEDQQENER